MKKEARVHITDVHTDVRCPLTDIYYGNKRPAITIKADISGDPQGLERGEVPYEATLSWEVPDEHQCPGLLELNLSVARTTCEDWWTYDKDNSGPSRPYGMAQSRIFHCPGCGKELA